MRIPEIGEDLRGKVCVDSSGRTVIVTRKVSGEWAGMEIPKRPRVFMTSRRNELAVTHETLHEYMEEMTQP